MSVETCNGYEIVPHTWRPCSWTFEDPFDRVAFNRTSPMSKRAVRELVMKFYPAGYNPILARKRRSWFDKLFHS